MNLSMTDSPQFPLRLHIRRRHAKHALHPHRRLPEEAITLFRALRLGRERRELLERFEERLLRVVLLLVEGSAGFLKLGDGGAELGELFEVGGDLGGGEEGADAEEDDR